MSADSTASEFMGRVLERLHGLDVWTEIEAPDGGPYLPLTLSEDPDTSAGALRAWRAADATPLDRMLQMHLVAGPVRTELLFVFGLAGSTMPHLHVQVVRFPPDGCVYNVDFLPRLDPVDYPEWFTRVFAGLRRAYRRATADRENSCDQAPANPALALYMSPWGIASGRTDRAELERVAPQMHAYVEHYCALAGETDWTAPPGLDLAARDARHLELFFSDELDPRAWNGVYKTIGEARGKVVKRIFQTRLRD